MIIPHRELSPEALQGLIEDFVTREGTGHADMELPLKAKAAEVRRQLDNGSCFILYDLEHETFTLVPKTQLDKCIGNDD